MMGLPANMHGRWIVTPEVQDKRDQWWTDWRTKHGPRQLTLDFSEPALCEDCDGEGDVECGRCDGAGCRRCDDTGRVACACADTDNGDDDDD